MRVLWLLMFAIALVFSSCTQNSSTDGRYRKSTEGVIIDRKTGLQWYVTHDKKQRTWDEVNTEVEKLTIAGSAWRLPTRHELRGIYEKGKGKSNIDPIFTTDAPVWAWGEAMDSWLAWHLYFRNGTYAPIEHRFDPSCRVFAVRFGR